MKKNSFYVRVFDDYGYIIKESGFIKPWHAIFTWIKWYKENEATAIFAADKGKAFELISYAYYKRSNIRWYLKKFGMRFNIDSFINNITAEFNAHKTSIEVDRALFPFDLSEKN